MAGLFRSCGTVLGAFALLVAAASAQAQEIATQFDQLRVLLKPGDTVTVIDGTGNEAKGKILALSSSSLELSVNGTQRSWAESQTRTVSQQRHASFGTGAKWGFFVGAGLGALAILSDTEGDYSDYGGKGVVALGEAGLIGGLGAGIGVGVSSLIRRSHVVYVGRPAPPAKLTLSPVLLDGRTGAAVSLRF